MAATDLLGLTEARSAIRARSDDTSGDDDLRELYIPAVTTIVEDLVGPVVKRSVTVTVAGGGKGITLDEQPVAAVTSVVESGVTLAGTDYVVDLDAGIVYRGTPTATRRWTAGLGAVVITYDAGRVANTAAVPASIKLAARIILRNEWENDRNGNRPDLAGQVNNDTVATPAGYAIPRRAYQYLEPFSQVALPAIGGV